VRTDTQVVSAVLFLLVTVSLGCNFRSRRLRTLILVSLITAGIINAIYLSTGRGELVHSNFAHYYLGSKYTCSYADFYKLVTAAREKPQVAYTDLPNQTMFRDDPREQRVYYQSLLAANGAEFSPREPLETLQAMCTTNGLIKHEAQQILNSRFGPKQMEDFRRDVSRTDLKTTDMGFNASPFYVFARRFDPLLHLPLSAWVGEISALAQILGLILATTIAARIMNWSFNEALTVLALLVCSRDFCGWAVSGLVFAGWLLPILLGLYFSGRGRNWLSGFCVACAGMVKLFPFILILPHAVNVLRQFTHRLRHTDASETDKNTGTDQSLCFLAACVASSAVLLCLGSLSGYSWLEFMRKITTQFLNNMRVGNNVSFTYLMSLAGIVEGRFILPVKLTVLLSLGWIAWKTSNNWARTDLARFSILSLSCFAWMASLWLNYYSIVTFFMIPWCVKKSRFITVFLLLLHSGVFFLPGFGHTYQKTWACAYMVQVYPYLLLPLFALFLELREAGNTVAATDSQVGKSRLQSGPVLLVACACLSIVMIVMGLRHAAILRNTFDKARQLNAEGKLDEAVKYHRRILAMAPEDAQAYYNLAMALDGMGNFAEAESCYLECLKLNPKLISAYVNAGILRIKTGDVEDGISLFLRALDTVPYDETLHYNLGIAYSSLGKKDKASYHFRTALALNPEFRQAREALIGVTSPLLTNEVPEIR
jgi:Flp pilus assembly protein TadD